MTSCNGRQHAKNDADIPKDQAGIPIIDPTDQVRPAEPEAGSHYNKRHDLAGYQAYYRTHTDQSLNKWASFLNAEAKTAQCRERIQKLEI
jgi:hypothetical protein